MDLTYQSTTTLARIRAASHTRDGWHVPGVYTSPDGLQIKIEVTE